MNLTEAQLAKLTQLAPTEDGKFWRELLGGYILEIKDDCVLGELPKDAARVAIEKLNELISKITVLSDVTGPHPSRRFD